jgi:hypothetical protein
LVQDELQSIDNKLRRQSRTTNEDSVSLSNRIKAIEDLKLNDRLNQLESDVASLKNIVAFISIFNLLAIAGGLGFLVYQVMLKSNSGADRRKKRSSNSLGKPPSPHGQSNPSQSAGMGMGGRRSGGMGSRSQGVEAHSFDEQAPENEDIIPESRNLPRPNFRLNEWRQNQDNRDTQGIEESSNVDHRDALEPPNVPARRGSNRPSVSSNLEHGKLTESLALQHYQSRMYKVLEDFGVGYYSATPESVARNRSDWANPLELVEFFDGLFWIIKTTDRYLLFPNPRLRIEQTRIRGIEYFFETNFTFEGYQSYQVTLPAHVDLINGKWLRLRKGQITFS